MSGHTHNLVPCLVTLHDDEGNVQLDEQRNPVQASYQTCTDCSYTKDPEGVAPSG